MEINLKPRINALESKIISLQSADAPDHKMFSEIYSQIAVIDSLIKFYNIEEDQNYKDLKMIYYKHSNDYYIYNSNSEVERLENMNQNIDHIYSVNTYIRDFANTQDLLIDNVSSLMNAADQNLSASNIELEKYSKYVDKKNRIYRIICLFLMVLVVILFIKTYHVLF